MISLYGKTYAANDSQAIESLFNRGGTVNGFYKKTRSGVLFSDMQGRERVFIRKDGLGPISVHRYDGKLRYMFSTATSDESWLGLPDSYIAKCEGARDLARQMFG